jgi:DNA-binding transcriptional LysR family regulator
MLAVAAPSYLGRAAPPMTPRDLHAHDCIRHRSAWDGAIHPWEFAKGDDRLDIAVDGRLVVNDTQLVLSAALDGIGIAYVPERCTEAHIAEGRLVPLLEDWSVWRSGLFLYYPSRRQAPAPLRAFIDFMRRHMRQNGGRCGTTIEAAPQIRISEVVARLA